MKLRHFGALVVLFIGLVDLAFGAEEKRPIACAPIRTALAGAGGNAVFQDCPDAPQMIAIRGGSFSMGDLFGNGRDYEKPLHTVRVEPFALGRFEVTVAQWKSCVDAGACPAIEAHQNAKAEEPAASVSWDEAEQYVAWLSQRTGQRYRLPSEAEWEYAARAGADMQFTWGNLDSMSCQYANAFDRAGRAASPSWTWSVNCNDRYGKAAPVGSYPPNAWGLHDMLGNVWEWVEDCWHSDYQDAPTTSSAWTTGDCTRRVNRGGGWGNHPRSLRVSNRDGDKQTARSDGMGFRVARNLAAQSADAGGRNP